MNVADIIGMNSAGWNEKQCEKILDSPGLSQPCYQDARNRLREIDRMKGADEERKEEAQRKHRQNLADIRRRQQVHHDEGKRSGFPDGRSVKHSTINGLGFAGILAGLIALKEFFAALDQLLDSWTFQAVLSAAPKALGIMADAVGDKWTVYIVSGMVLAFLITLGYKAFKFYPKYTREGK